MCICFVLLCKTLHLFAALWSEVLTCSELLIHREPKCTKTSHFQSANLIMWPSIWPGSPTIQHISWKADSSCPRLSVWKVAQDKNLAPNRKQQRQTSTNSHKSKHRHKRKVFTHRAIPPSSLTLSHHRPWAALIMSLRPTMCPVPHYFAAIALKLNKDCVHLRRVEAAVPKQHSSAVNMRVSQLSTKHILRRLKPKQQGRLSNSDRNPA